MLETKEKKYNKPMGRFKSIDEAAKYKTDLVEKIFAKVDRKALENLGK